MPSPGDNLANGDSGSVLKSQRYEGVRGTPGPSPSSSAPTTPPKLLSGVPSRRSVLSSPRPGLCAPDRSPTPHPISTGLLDPQHPAPPPASAAIPPVLPARQCQAPPPLSVHTPPRFIPPSSLLPLPSLSCCCRSSSPRGRPASCPLNPALRAHPNLLLPQPFRSQLLRPKLDFRLDSSLLSHLS